MPDITVSLTRTGTTASEARIRDHHMVMDRPTEKGGENAGPMGGEALLAALGGCFMSNLVAAAQARDVELGDIDVSITGTLAGTPPVYERIAMTVTGAASIESLPKLVTMAERGCIVANTLKAGLTLTVETRQG
ncbi:OsmC family protein [Saccharospirillum alexandrii]|uniref:OsmC family protein n=1 Tax=Saccharospirillum alexandrii TaxID=2448477 RepID=UPI003735EC8E